MSGGESTEAMRQAAREVLRELLPELIGELHAAPPPTNGNGKRNGNGDHAPAAQAIPRVPALPVAAVMRPSTWAAPPAPGEVIGDGQTPAMPAPPAPSADVEDADGAEAVTLDTDEDLQRFVAALVQRFANPRERRALQTGQLRFRLRRTTATGATGAATAAAAAQAPPAIHIEKGAVTERIVREAAASGARLVLARRAVLTPLARDQARVLRVTIEREQT